MKKRVGLLCIVTMVFLLLSTVSGCKWDKDDDPGMPGGTGEPEILVTDVPTMHSYQDLRGQVYHVWPDDCCVVVWIEVWGGWWIKPYWDDPTTNIDSKGKWVCDVTTGGVDEEATHYAVYLVPKNYEPDLYYYDREQLEEDALDWDYVAR